MFAFAIAERDSGRVLLGRDRLGIKPLYLTEDAPPHPVRLVAARAGGRRRRRHPHRPGRPAPLPVVPLGGARRRTPSCAACASCRPASLLAIEPDGTPHAPRPTGTPDFTRHADRADWSERDWEDAVLDVAAHRGRAPAGRRRARRLPAVRRGGLQPDRRPARRGRASTDCRRSPSASSRSAASRATSSCTPTSSPSASAPTTTRSASTPHRMLPALDGAIGAMSEPMVSHDCVAFYLLSQEVAKHVKVVQSGQGADEVFAGYHWYPADGRRRRRRHRRLRWPGIAPRSSTATTAASPGCAAEGRLAGADPSGRLRHRALRPRRRRDRRRPGAATGHHGDAGRRSGQARRQHDHGLGPGGPGAVPRPRTRRAGGDLPARAQDRARRQGCAEGGCPPASFRPR